MALTVICGTSAAAAIERMARSHPHLAHHIRELGAAFLRRATGLRDGRNGASKTYDLGFVDDSGAFADLTAEAGKFNRATDGRLEVQLRHKGETPLRAFEPKSLSSEVERGWHATQVEAGDSIAPLLEDLKHARC